MERADHPTGSTGGTIEGEMRVIYIISRLTCGGWFAFSGAWHFFWPWLQPMGNHPTAVAFTKALLASGLFDWIKALELVTGLLIIANRAMPLVILAIAPINVVIVYWNIVLDPGPVEWIFSLLTILLNAVLAWPWRSYFWRFFTWRGQPDYSLQAAFPDRSYDWRERTRAWMED